MSVKDKTLRAVKVGSSFAVAIAVWQIAAMAIGHTVLLASPVEVLVRLLGLLFEKETYSVLFYSLTRILLGFFLGLVVGSAAAVVASRFEIVKNLLFPYMITVRSVPVASFIVLALVWLEAAELSTFISFLIVLPVIYNSLLGALEAMDRVLDEMAMVFHLSLWHRMRYVWIPQIRAALLASCSTAVGLAWKSGVAAELIGLADGSIGDELYSAKLYLDTPTLFAWTVLIVAASLASEKLIVWLLRLALTKRRAHA
ncbi:MAG: ABC transporter permease subunit [Clostridia bacterium]|nr:ABC transporter permease subunit [Clostridia bacterium]